MRQLLIIALAALGSLAAGLAVLPEAAAQEPGISLWRGRFEPPDCTVGRTFTVQWRVPEATAAVVDGIAREGESGEAEINCGPAPAGWEIWAARYGAVPRREVVATARAADGELLTAALSVPMRAPVPPPPAIASVWARAYGGSADVRFADYLHLRNERVRLMIRWRDAAGGRWRGGMASTNRPLYTRLPLEREPPRAWLWGYITPPGTYEFQAAYGEIWAPPYGGVDLPEEFEWGYLLHPDQIEWSDSAFITVVDDLPRFSAETTPDSITVHLADGIAVDDVQLTLVPRDWPYWQYEDDHDYQDHFAIAADDAGARGTVRWSGLESAADYVLSARWRREDYPPNSLLLDLRTESAPPGFEPAQNRFSRFSATAQADRIVLEWEAPAGAEDDTYSAVAYRYGTLVAASERSDLRGPSHRVALEGLDPGSAYEVVVRRERDDGMAFESRLVIETEPSAEPPAATGDIDPPELAEPAHGWFGVAGCLPEPPELQIEVADAEGWELFEYEWTLDGRSMRWRHAKPRLDLLGIGRGRYEIRARGFRDGVWSPWSGWTTFSLEPQATETTDAASAPDSGGDEPSDSSEERFREAPQPEPVEAPEYSPVERWMPPIEIEAVAATTEGIHIAWNCLDHVTAGVHRVHTRYVIRWREAGSQAWTYARGDSAYAYPLCHHNLTGLRSGASYELGVAAYFSDHWPSDAPNPEWLEWADVRMAAMPVPISGAWITRESGRTMVAWTAQPDVLRYVAVLRGEGRSWHQVVSASGASAESATFNGLPEGAAYSAEVLLAPAARGDERRLGPWRRSGGCE